MKAIPFRIAKAENTSLIVQVDEGASFYDKLHYHPEWQITAIEKGEGILYVGNSFIEFQPGDIIMIGSNVPHLIKSNESSLNEVSMIRATSIFFHHHSFGPHFFDLPEMASVNKLLYDSLRGIKFAGTEYSILHDLIVSSSELSDINLIHSFFGVLKNMINAKTKQIINLNAMTVRLEESHGARMNDIFDFTMANIANEILVEAVAKKVNLSISQFSRYFKTHTRKTYIQFLNELRIEKACSLIRKNEKSIELIAIEVGYKNLSNFNRQFKKIKKMTPSVFRNLLQ